MLQMRLFGGRICNGKNPPPEEGVQCRFTAHVSICFTFYVCSEGETEGFRALGNVKGIPLLAAVLQLVMKF